MNKQRIVIIGCLLLGVALGGAGFYFGYTIGFEHAADLSKGNTAANFEACAAAGYPIMESYPRQCRMPDGRTFIEEIGNETDKTDLIRVSYPRPNQTIASPLEILGEARGYWFFEASFPIRLYDERGNELAVAVAQAEGDWMTEEFVPFRATLEFAAPEFSAPEGSGGTLVFQKDNPSGLPEHDDALEIPVLFGPPSPGSGVTSPPLESKEPIFCTQDVKLCPDGSYVSRTGPKCEFAPCPQ